MFKIETRRWPWFFWSFEFGLLDIVSDFVLRISDFQLLRKSQRSLDLRFKPLPLGSLQEALDLEPF
jgi:hypothetical protein